ncbi:MAG: O-antigen ligase family protein [Maritimibacter sp.]
MSGSETWQQRITVTETFPIRLGSVFVIVSLGASLVMSLDPLRATDNVTALKYLPLIMMFLGMLCLFIAGIPKRVLHLFALMALLILSILMTLGALVPLLSGAQLADSYLGRGLNLLAAPTGALVAANPSALDRVTRSFKMMFLVVSVIGLAMLVAKSLGLIYPNVGHILHIETTFFVAGLIWVARRWPFLLLRLAIIGLLAWLSIETGKSTTLLLLGVFVFATFVLDGFMKFRRLARDNNQNRAALTGLLLYFAVLSASGALWFFISTIVERATRYQNDLRAEMWADRWEKFTSSPLIGQMFTDSPIYRNEHLAGTLLSTHNDFLDVLASGGILGITLFLALPISIGFRKTFYRSLTADNRRVPTVAIYGFIFLAYLVSGLGNPFLPVPRLAAVVWFSMGVLGMHVQNEVHKAARWR